MAQTGLRKCIGFLYLAVLMVSTFGKSATAAASEAESKAEYMQDLVVDLPGLPSDKVRGDQYAGYIQVDEAGSRSMFYWFVEAMVEDPTKKPVTLFLNGGPACSSIGGGMMSEVGPYYPNKPGSGLIPNDYTWTKESNMLFLESPVGVGFSFSNLTGAYETGDSETAEDARWFLLKWFARFPHFIGNELFITGESYGGHYVPTLALHILERPPDEGMPRLNLRGFAVGNAWTDTHSDNRGTIDFWWDRALISTATKWDLYHKCNLSTDFYDNYKKIPTTCSIVTTKAITEMGNLNIYAVYLNACLSETSTFLKHRFRDVPNLFGPVAEEAPSGNGALGSNLKWDYDPCVDNEVGVYLNRPDVQKALHANVTVKIPYPWQGCSKVVEYSDRDVERSMLPTYVKLLQHPIRIWVYSGDTDGVVPIEGTRYWLEQLQRQKHIVLTKPWSAWYEGLQVGGHSEEYNNASLVFVTMRGAGHVVPRTQPARALQMFKHFMRGTSLPTDQGSTVPNAAAAAGGRLRGGGKGWRGPSGDGARRALRKEGSV